MRMRSPRMAPPLKGEVGSMASTATWSTSSPARPSGQPARAWVIRRSVRVDFPAGAPVSPTEYGRGAR